MQKFIERQFTVPKLLVALVMAMCFVTAPALYMALTPKVAIAAPDAETEAAIAISEAEDKQESAEGAKEAQEKTQSVYDTIYLNYIIAWNDAEEAGVKFTQAEIDTMTSELNKADAALLSSQNEIDLANGYIDTGDDDLELAHFEFVVMQDYAAAKFFANRAKIEYTKSIIVYDGKKLTDYFQDASTALSAVEAVLNKYGYPK